MAGTYFNVAKGRCANNLSGCDISDDICHAVNKQQKADYLEGDICNRYQVIGQVAVKSEHGCIHQ